MIDRRSCSEYSLEQGECILGTAPRVDLWLLLEHPQVWSPDAIDTDTLPTDVQRWLHNTVDTFKRIGKYPRVQMIRKSRNLRSAFSMFIAQSGLLRYHSMHSYDEILDLCPDKNFGEKVEENNYFVCTHGTRDRCCAKHGHRTWTVLNELSDGRAWQCSHLGGHRFAPNVLVLPQGRLYGRVHAEEAERFYRLVEDDELATKHLRGRSEYSPEDQVREAGIEPIRGSPIQIRESCTKRELKTVYPFIET
ncbi:MAG: hypothetical protein F4Z01_03185 [Gammaproteobacteria bacterium]|nr:hypothetical protein [Gammaproteobacteria bacterium]MYF37392.1 hypothetical protein [Gammaproteobacteria bacterium]